MHSHDLTRPSRSLATSDNVPLFSARSSDYAQFRPTYPNSLFVWLAAQCRQTERVLDIGAGNGQATFALTEHFDTVLACDASPQQLASGSCWGSVLRFTANAQQLPLADGQLDAIVVAQALHWFATPTFFAETQRALKRDGLFCAWCYSLLRISPAIDEIIDHLHSDILQDHWPEGRASVDQGYRNIQPPFTRIAVPASSIEASWSFHHLVGYLRTWSAAKHWQQIHGKDPIATIESELLRCWGDPHALRPILWPLHFLAGYPGHRSAPCRTNY